eukprot:c9875_g1_i2.p1 GENE.c9875_g1_i2~~c9875_g1_i2.p1  ORF type:complete len:670 (+),score=222.97 c9875_g1_i2:35-2044(+)
MDPRKWARRLVSQNKRRLKNEKFDLDLSYITDQIIAMGLPATGVEQQYRNPIDEVVRFLEENHKGKYKVFNLCSERLYDPSKFNGFMANFPFDDHNVPPIELIPMFCKSAKEWLRGGLDNVVCVHCKAGKSRTGLMIAALLLHLQYFDVPQAAIDFYNRRRTHDGKGLVVPSQIRYVFYYDHILKHGMPPPTRKILKSITIDGSPSGWTGVYVNVVSVQREVLFTQQAIRKGALLAFECNFDLTGDFKLEFREQSQFVQSKPLMYLWLNTSFVGNIEVLRQNQVDKLKETVDPDFQVIFLFEPDANGPTDTLSSSVTAAAAAATAASATKETTQAIDEEKDDIDEEESNEQPNEQTQTAEASRIDESAVDTQVGAVSSATITAEPDGVSLATDTIQTVDAQVEHETPTAVHTEIEAKHHEVLEHSEVTEVLEQSEPPQTTEHEIASAEEPVAREQINPVESIEHQIEVLEASTDEVAQNVEAVVEEVTAVSSPALEDSKNEEPQVELTQNVPSVEQPSVTESVEVQHSSELDEFTEVVIPEEKEEKEVSDAESDDESEGTRVLPIAEETTTEFAVPILESLDTAEPSVDTTTSPQVLLDLPATTTDTTGSTAAVAPVSDLLDIFGESQPSTSQVASHATASPNVLDLLGFDSVETTAPDVGVDVRGDTN